MNLVRCFVDQVRSQPSSVALRILDGDGISSASYTWLDLGELVTTCRKSLQRFAKQWEPTAGPPHVASWLPNGLEWIAIDLAVQSLGWVHVPIDFRLPPAAANQLETHCQASLLVVQQEDVRFEASRQTITAQSLFATSSTCESVLALEVPELQSHRPAQIMYTSGTMSHPKGVMLSHENLLSNARAKLVAAPQFDSDVRLNILPFAHAYARTCELSTWIITGGQLCLVADWNSLLRWAPRLQPTLVNLVPHLANKLAHTVREQGGDGSEVLGQRLRLLQVGGAALPRSTWDTLAAAGWPPLQGYGLTETSPVVCSNHAGHQQPDSVGWPVPGVELRLDEQGVLWTKGPQVMLGYWNDVPATEERIQDGWLCTGDLAAIGDDGRVRILGRVDDQIVLSTGYKVSPLELTQLLANDPWIESVVLVGQGRPFLAALILPRWSAIPEEFHAQIDRLCELILARWDVHWQSLAAWMQVKRLAFMTEPLSIENHGLNYKGAVRRKFVEEQLCADIVEELYGGY